VQTCIVHLIRHSPAFVSWKVLKTILPDIRAISRAETAEAAAVRLDEFDAGWSARYPAIGPTWQHVVPMFAFPPAIRKTIYTTNAVESQHRSLRKIIKTRGSFPNDEVAVKLLFLAIGNAGIHWRRPVEWTAAMGKFAVLFSMIVFRPQRVCPPQHAEAGKHVAHGVQWDRSGEMDVGPRPLISQAIAADLRSAQAGN
jgi:putative transposase